MKKHPWRLAALVVVLALVGVVALVDRAQFLVGTTLWSLGTHLQDRAHDFDLVHHSTRPEHIWEELQAQNALSSRLLGAFPREAAHPVVAILMCMDARLDTAELAGDARHAYYVVRTAGSVLNEVEEDMLELAVENGVKVLVLTTHTDCAAERAAASPESRARFPALTRAVDEREARIAEFLQRPAIQRRVESGELLIKRVVIHTGDDAFEDPAAEVHDAGPATARRQ